MRELAISPIWGRGGVHARIFRFW